jgi:hypothetical protein
MKYLLIILHFLIHFDVFAQKIEINLILDSCYLKYDKDRHIIFSYEIKNLDEEPYWFYTISLGYELEFYTKNMNPITSSYTSCDAGEILDNVEEFFLVYPNTSKIVRIKSCFFATIDLNSLKDKEIFIAHAYFSGDTKKKKSKYKTISYYKGTATKLNFCE